MPDVISLPRIRYGGIQVALDSGFRRNDET